MNPWNTLLAITLLVATTGVASAKHCDACPDCNQKVCTATPKETTIDRHCYEVECKEICIPTPRFPWGKTKKRCQGPRCGRTRMIRVMKKVNFECKSCGCTWEITSVSGCDSADDGCDSPAANEEENHAADETAATNTPASAPTVPTVRTTRSWRLPLIHAARNHTMMKEPTDEAPSFAHFFGVSDVNDHH